MDRHADSSRGEDVAAVVDDDDHVVVVVVANLFQTGTISRQMEGGMCLLVHGDRSHKASDERHQRAGGMETVQGRGWP